MRLRSMRIRRLPGIDPGFELPDAKPGINVVIGPNASGKSSVLRAVRALLYPDELKHAVVDVDATFEDDRGAMQATRVGGVVAWSRDGVRVAPPELPPHHLLDCYTLGVEDLAALSGTDEEIARQLGLELLGGYDLDAVRASAPLKPPSAGRGEAERLRRAEDRLREVLRDHAELRRQQARIAGWKRDLQEANAAAEEAEAHRRALALLEAQRELRDLRERLASFPQGMDRLRGNEAERLESLRGRRSEAEEQARAAYARRREAQQALADSDLQESRLSNGEIEEYRGLLQEAHRLESDVEALAGEASKAWAHVHEAEAQLRAAPEAGREAPPTPPTPPGAARPRLDPDTLRAVEDGLAARRSLEAERRALQRELETLPEPEAGLAPEDDVARLREGRRSLMAFLAAARARRRGTAVVLGLTLSVVGAGSAIALAVLAGSDWPLLATAGVVAAAGAALLARDRTASARRDAAARYRSTGLEVPQAWDGETVDALLLRLDEDLIRATQRREHLARREELARRLAKVERDLDESVARLQAVAEAVGFDPRQLDAGFQRWLRLVDAADRARTEHAEARAEHDRKRDILGNRLRSLRSFLTAHGEEPTSADAGADALQRRLDTLARRLADRDRAVSDSRAADADITRAEGERARQDEEIAALFADAGLAAEVALDSDAGRGTPRTGEVAEAEGALAKVLVDRLERLTAFEELRTRERDAEIRSSLRLRELGDRDDLRALVEDDAEASLRDALEALERSARSSEELTREITRTETLIAQAERERTLQNARAERQEAADALADVVEATLRAEAGHFLLDRVEAEHEQRSQPPALHRAAEWFRRFTRNRFELDYDARREPPFAAIETTTGERRLPAELSTGTRAQLLLAVRVAFAVEAEGGRASLPLFLDEALTTADAERFRAVADSLALLAREDGRQLFYLTARAEDAALWRDRTRSLGTEKAGPDVGGTPPHIIDIARLRRDAEGITEPQTLEVAEPGTVPAPDGLKAERYATLLGVPALDPWRSPDTCHPYHLLRDDLSLVHRLAQAGVERVGSLRSLLRSPVAGALLSADERVRVERRLRALETFVEGWRRGRGRPVDRGALEASGAVSATFMDRVDALARVGGGDAEALVGGLERGDVPRFRTRDREALSAWLEQHGYLDDRTPLDAAGLRMRLVAVLAEGAAATANDGTRHRTGTEADRDQAVDAWGDGDQGDGEGDSRPRSGGDPPLPAGQPALHEAEQVTLWLSAAIRAGRPHGERERTGAGGGGSAPPDTPSE